ncbi:MAG: helix-turn-helix domain-containing protein [Candidatus Thiodiazotropha sp. (ex Lucinoma aequizonata)]|nr:helix-turn-helix domain-containing protein [Candidatus Thiodiazotropha sp. (ex Lucinoma aequizonata)]
MKMGTLHGSAVSQIEIAQLLYRSASTISHELRRNRGLRGYRPAQAQDLSEACYCKSHKACRITDEVQACLRSRERFWDIPVHQNRLDL